MIELGWGAQLDENFQKFHAKEFTNENNNERQNQPNMEVVPINGKPSFF